MAQPTRPAPERVVASRLYTDPDAYTAANGLSGGRVAGRIPQGFRARIAWVDLGQVGIIVGRATAPLTMYGQVGPVHAFTLGTSQGAPRTLSGREVGFGRIFHHRPSESFLGHSPSGQPWPFGTVAVSFETLARLAPRFAGRELAPSRRDATLIATTPATRDRLIALLHDADCLAEMNPEIARHDGPAQGLAGATLDALLACLAQGRGEPDRAALRRHNRIVARLETLLQEQPEHPWSLAELCAAIATSERTLNVACQEFYGANPIRVVRDRRLDAVREALRQADPKRTSVAAEAMRFGFWELGRFSGAYRDRFGELPSATLRREPDQTAPPGVTF